MLNTSKNVSEKAIIVALVKLCQNLNSGSLRINGRNSSLELVGRVGPSSSENQVTGGGCPRLERDQGMKHFTQRLTREILLCRRIYHRCKESDE